MKNLTEKQAKFLRYILEYTLENFYQPSWKEIGFHMGISGAGNGVRDYLYQLDRKGYLECPNGDRIPRALIIHDKAFSWYLTQEISGTRAKVAEMLLRLRGVIRVKDADSRTQ